MHQCISTDGNGNYALTELPAGEYLVTFNPEDPEQNLLPQWFSGSPDAAGATPVQLMPGEVRTSVDAQLQPGAEISGEVFDAATGRPLPDIEVCLLEFAPEQLGNCARTQQTGLYRILRLTGSEYQVVFSPTFSEFGEGSPEEEPDGYLTQFYDRTADRSQALTLHPTPGEPATGIDGFLVAERKEEEKPVPPKEEVKPPTPTPPIVTPPHVVRCRHGFHRKRVRGKVRCVRNRRVHRHRHRVVK